MCPPRIHDLLTPAHTEVFFFFWDDVRPPSNVSVSFPSFPSGSVPSKEGWRYLFMGKVISDNCCNINSSYEGIKQKLFLFLINILLPFSTYLLLFLLFSFYLHGLTFTLFFRCIIQYTCFKKYNRTLYMMNSKHITPDILKSHDDSDVKNINAEVWQVVHSLFKPNSKTWLST